MNERSKNDITPQTPYMMPIPVSLDFNYPYVLPFPPMAESLGQQSASTNEAGTLNPLSMNSPFNNQFMFSQFPTFAPLNFSMNNVPIYHPFQTAPIPHLIHGYQNNMNLSNEPESNNTVGRVNRPRNKKTPKERPDYEPCCAKNKKTGKPCRNPALMEYIGEKPQYCAEHIETDANSIYCKCKSNFGKEIGDGKRCKEVVLKEFMFCSKHLKYHYCDLQTDPSALPEVRSKLARCKELYNKLSQEIQIVRHSNQILFYRKSKLLPKYEKMAQDLEECVDTLEQLQASPIKEHAKQDTGNAPKQENLSVDLTTNFKSSSNMIQKAF
eukprot:TRINITY_DN2489_c0_g1_i2.p1 TRINITY_DN2489_c0_g1~~TRINITY_DN2489_c0_g1_i2.p1  ORF type:complete len:337 (-),score=80.65 TRINITY_DN2489_c0_g1_i2:42-1016(-)